MRRLILAATVLALAGCMQIRTERLVAVPLNTAPSAGDSLLSHATTAGLIVGIDAISPIWQPLSMSDDQLRTALQASFALAGYEAQPGAAPSFRLSAGIVALESTIDMQMFSGAATAVAIIRYRLDAGERKEALLDEVIETECRVTTADAPLGDPIARRSAECAVQRNISNVMSRLREIDRSRSAVTNPAEGAP